MLACMFWYRASSTARMLSWRSSICCCSWSSLLIYSMYSQSCASWVMAHLHRFSGPSPKPPSQLVRSLLQQRMQQIKASVMISASLKAATWELRQGALERKARGGPTCIDWRGDACPQRWPPSWQRCGLRPPLFHLCHGAFEMRRPCTFLLEVRCVVAYVISETVFISRPCQHLPPI